MTAAVLAAGGIYRHHEESSLGRGASLTLGYRGLARPFSAKGGCSVRAMNSVWLRRFFSPRLGFGAPIAAVRPASIAP